MLQMIKLMNLKQNTAYKPNTIVSKLHITNNRNIDKGENMHLQQYLKLTFTHYKEVIFKAIDLQTWNSGR
ncbi:unnamed protein product [Paramecium octaurelia]|uniref:Uncharacterized protein n=1 Tax=Paramecium octaurelia TaxID=43137 RepID=A0A8S1TN35_PAROT|nr:unnamed protein product [Paramecium octaurelia]